LKSKINFVNKLFAEQNKSNDQKQMEALEEKVKKAQIACRSQISILETSSIPMAQLELESAELELTEAKSFLEKARFQDFTDYKDYVANKEEAKDAVEDAENAVKQAKQKIEDLQYQVKVHQENLEDLS